MIAFRILLATVIFVVVFYTGFVIAAHGWGFFSVFFGDIVAMNWAGQFNLDFSCFLVLSGLWIAWRNHFTSVGIALGAFALVGGAPFLAAYLLIKSIQTRGDIYTLLLGESRSRQKV
jgi:hypothetical protein